MSTLTPIMSFSWNLTLHQDIAITFNESFSDKDNPTREVNAWIYKTLTKVASQWTSVLGNGGFASNIKDKDTGEVTQKEVKLKDIALEEYNAVSDPEWIPDKLDKDTSQVIASKLGPKLEDKLKKVISVSRYIALNFNKSFLEYAETNPDDLSDSKLQDKLKTLRSDMEDYNKLPLEKFLSDFIIPEIVKKTVAADQKEMDAEFDELYADEDKKENGDDPPLPGTRTPRKD